MATEAPEAATNDAIMAEALAVMSGGAQNGEAESAKAETAAGTQSESARQADGGGAAPTAEPKAGDGGVKPAADPTNQEETEEGSVKPPDYWAQVGERDRQRREANQLSRENTELKERLARLEARLISGEPEAPKRNERSIDEVLDALARGEPLPEPPKEPEPIDMSRLPAEVVAKLTKLDEIEKRLGLFETRAQQQSREAVERAQLDVIQGIVTGGGERFDLLSGLGAQGPQQVWAVAAHLVESNGLVIEGPHDERLPQLYATAAQMVEDAIEQHERAKAERLEQSKKLQSIYGGRAPQKQAPRGSLPRVSDRGSEPAELSDDEIWQEALAAMKSG